MGHRYVLGATLLGFLLLGAACQPNIQITRQPGVAATATAVEVPRPLEHNLTLLGVDFDPPLDHLDLALGQGVVLMTAVQNTGLYVEEDVLVTARLFDVAQDRNRPALLAESTSYIARIAPGEVAIARFEPLTWLPLRDRYHLRVELRPVVGETDLSDNDQTYEIVVEPQNQGDAP
ncbi:MAG: hypothetical protein Kow0047_28180 [Anaerolineae bacterium]